MASHPNTDSYADFGGDADARVRVAIARDADTAERWRDALDAAGIDAFVEIDDDRAAIPGSASVLSVYTGPRYVYPINVPADERERAAGVLINHGWDGAHGTRMGESMSATRIVWGTIAVLVVTLLAVLVLVNIE
jgi:hypothetical protein